MDYQAKWLAKELLVHALISIVVPLAFVVSNTESKADLIMLLPSLSNHTRPESALHRLQNLSTTLHSFGRNYVFT